MPVWQLLTFWRTIPVKWWRQKSICNEKSIHGKWGNEITFFCWCVIDNMGSYCLWVQHSNTLRSPMQRLSLKDTLLSWWWRLWLWFCFLCFYFYSPHFELPISSGYLTFWEAADNMRFFICLQIKDIFRVRVSQILLEKIELDLFYSYSLSYFLSFLITERKGERESTYFLFPLVVCSPSDTPRFCRQRAPWLQSLWICCSPTEKCSVMNKWMNNVPLYQSCYKYFHVSFLV